MTSFIRQLNLYGFRKLRSTKRQSYTHPYLESGRSLKEIICVKKMESLNGSTENRIPNLTPLNERNSERM